MIERAYGKINVSINVLSRRADGYHDLDMIMVPIDLYDELDIEIADEMSFSSNCDIAFNEKNTVYRAIELLRSQFGFKDNFKIYLRKNIPMEAGLAGGSTDGAATLRAVNQLLNLGLSLQQLAEIGVKIGADFPYCIYSQPARVQGIGEIVTPFELNIGYDLLLIKPEEGVSTGKAYTTLNLDLCDHPDIETLISDFVNHRPMKLGNSLEESAKRLLDKIQIIEDECRSFGFDDVLMSGSGSTVFVLAESGTDMNKLENYMKDKYKFVLKTKLICR